MTNYSTRFPSMRIKVLVATMQKKGNNIDFFGDKKPILINKVNLTLPSMWRRVYTFLSKYTISIERETYVET